MQKDLHYYTIYSILLDCEYSEKDAEVIAYASQYVDDCNEQQTIKQASEIPFNNHIHVGNQIFRGIITQTFSLKTFTDETQNFVLIPFHFLPGNNPAIKFKKNNRINRYATTPANSSPIAEELLADVLSSNNNYQLGILLHTLVDTFSHQNFSGMKDDWNSVYPWYSPYSIAPNIGHAEVGQQPDTISDCWHDKRLRNQEKIMNQDRAMTAIEYVFRKLYEHKHPDANIANAWNAVTPTYKSLVCGSVQRKKDYEYDDRIKSIKKHVKKPNIKYDRKKWLEDAVTINKKDGRFVALSPQNFINSHFWQFQLAAQNQVALVWRILARYGL